MFNLEEILLKGFTIHGVDKMNLKSKVKKMETAIEKAVYYNK